MKAVIMQGIGGIEVLSLGEVPKPTPGPWQLLVRVKATALNRADLWQRRGKYPPPVGESEILGLEIAGDVVQCGENVAGFIPGQRVFGLVSGGGYAEYCVLDYQMAMLIPDDWSYAQAAAIPEVFLTANETLFELAQLQADGSLLLHAAGSGVGTAAIQMAHHLNVSVYVTAGSSDKITGAIALGATAGCNYHEHDYVSEVIRWTAGKGVDVVTDFVGGGELNRNLSVLKEGGCLLQIAVMGGARAEVDLGLLVRKRLQIKGFILRTRPLAEKRSITQRFYTRWYPVLAAGQIHPVISNILHLEEVATAHRLLEERQNFGKIVLTVA
jgi:NADPH:quinone reductase